MWIHNAVFRHASIWRERIYHVYSACTSICGHLHLERKSIPTSAGVLPLVGGDWSLKLAVCGEVGQTFSPLLLNPDLFFLHLDSDAISEPTDQRKLGMNIVT